SARRRAAACRRSPGRPRASQSPRAARAAGRRSGEGRSGRARAGTRPGWRWVMFVNPVACLLELGPIFLLLTGARRRVQREGFDLLGAVLATAGMLLLVYAL